MCELQRERSWNKKMISKRDGAIISAYTGFLIGEFSDMHKYVEETMDRPVFTHEFTNKEFIKEIQDKSREDFLNIKVNNM